MRLWNVARRTGAICGESSGDWLMGGDHQRQLFGWMVGCVGWADADGYCVVLSADRRWAALEAVAAQVARNGEDLEVMLKTQCQQDSSIW